MRRTQLYLDEPLWQALKLHARQAGKSVSELVREAARERYLGAETDRKRALLGIVGLRSDLPQSFDTEKYIRGLRKDSRAGRLRSR